LTTVWFLWDNFGSRNARKPIKGSKDSDGSLVLTKNLNEKIGSFDWRPGPRKLGKKTRKHPHLWRPPPENPKPKTKKFFFNLN